MATVFYFALAVFLITSDQIIGGHSARVPFYRYWNGRDHFYTTNIHEIGTSIPGHLGRHGYTSEGTVGYIENSQVQGTVPLYRYWNGADHFYTTNSHEIGTIVPGVKGKHGYTSEGIAGYCYPNQTYGKKPLYRAFNGEHFYTTDVNEMARALKGSYSFEGIQCYIG